MHICRRVAIIRREAKGLAIVAGRRPIQPKSRSSVGAFAAERRNLSEVVGPESRQVRMFCERLASPGSSGGLSARRKSLCAS